MDTSRKMTFTYPHSMPHSTLWTLQRSRISRRNLKLNSLLSPNTLCYHSHTLLLSGCRNRSGSLRGTTCFLAQQLLLSIVDCQKRSDLKFIWGVYSLFLLETIDITSGIDYQSLSKTKFCHIKLSFQKTFQKNLSYILNQKRDNHTYWFWYSMCQYNRYVCWNSKILN